MYTPRRVLLVCILAAGCASAPEASEPEPRPAQAAVNPCADPDYIALRGTPVERLDETQRRLLADMENACIDYRLGAQPGAGSVPDGADYSREVLPWVAGIAAYVGTLLLFIR